jgi:hypothetical protein
VDLEAEHGLPARGVDTHDASGGMVAKPIARSKA